MVVDLQFDTAVLESYLLDRITRLYTSQRICVNDPITYTFSVLRGPEPAVLDRAAVIGVFVEGDPERTNAAGIPDATVIRNLQRVLVPDDATPLDLDHSFFAPAPQVNVDIEIRLVALSGLRDAGEGRPDASAVRRFFLRTKLLASVGIDTTGQNLNFQVAYYDLYLQIAGYNRENGWLQLASVASTLGISLPANLSAILSMLRGQLPSISFPVGSLTSSIGAGLRLWNAGVHVNRTASGTPPRVLTLRLQFGPTMLTSGTPPTITNAQRVDRRAFANETETMWRSFRSAGPELRLVSDSQWAMFVDKELIFAGLSNGIDQEADATADVETQFGARVHRGSARPRWLVTDRGSELELGFDVTAVRACTVFWDIDLNAWITLRGPITLVERGIRERGRLIDIDHVIRFEFEVEGGIFTGDLIGCALGGFFFGDLGRWILYLYTRGPWYEVISGSFGSTWALPLGIILLFLQAWDPTFLPGVLPGSALGTLSVGAFQLERLSDPGSVRFAAELSFERMLRQQIPGLEFSEIVPSTEGLLIAGQARRVSPRVPELELDAVPASWKLQPAAGCMEPTVAAQLVLTGRNIGTETLSFCPGNAREAADYSAVRIQTYSTALRNASILVLPLDVPPGGAFSIRLRLSRDVLEQFQGAVNLLAGTPSNILLFIQTTGGKRIVTLPWIGLTTAALDQMQANVNEGCRVRSLMQQDNILPQLNFIPGIAESLAAAGLDPNAVLAVARSVNQPLLRDPMTLPRDDGRKK